MKTIRLVLLYLPLTTLILFTGCMRTVGTLEIEGNLIDELTKAKLPGREIIVEGVVNDGHRNQSIDAGQFTTDNAGHFKYTLNKIEDAYYYKFCLVGDSDYAYKIREFGLVELKQNARYLSLSVDKLVGLTIRIYRKTKVPAYDTLYMGWKSDGIDGRTLFPFKINNNNLSGSQELKWVGGEVRSTVKVRAYADKRATVRWALFRNGRSKEIIDTITCKRDRVNEVYLVY
jgi:hypothetical protein